MSEVFQAFRYYLAQNKRKDCQNHHLCTNGVGEYDKKKFTAF